MGDALILRHEDVTFVYDHRRNAIAEFVRSCFDGDIHADTPLSQWKNYTTPDKTVSIQRGDCIKLRTMSLDNGPGNRFRPVGRVVPDVGRLQGQLGVAQGDACVQQGAVGGVYDELTVRANG